MYRFSPSTLGFYIDQIHGHDIPADALPVATERFNQVMRDRLPGQKLVVDADGLPALYDVQPPSDTELLQNLHAAKTLNVNQGCEEAITSGFWSTALGERHQYSSELDDQLNLTGAIVRGLAMPYACRDEHGEKAYREHTATQLRQVGDDFTLYKLQLLQRAQDLKDQLDRALAAGDAAAVEAITWTVVQS